VVDPDLELSGGGGLGRGGGGREAVFVLLALPAFLPSVIFSFFFFWPKIRGALGPLGPSPRSATVISRQCRAGEINITPVK